MAFVKVISIEELQPGWVKETTVDGHPYALCNDGGEIHCLDGECPCTGGPLGHGALRQGLLVCPWHGWRYGVHDGACLYDDSIRIARFPVKVEGGDVLIDVTEPIGPSAGPRQ